jgi:tripartite-type tricarboxylate transporter receptor subunit TctC
MPNVPPVAEAAGLPDYSIQTWFALTGPAKMPRAVVDRLQREVEKIIAMPDIRERLGVLGMEPASDTSTATAGKTIRSEMDRLGKLADAAGIKPE